MLVAACLVRPVVNLRVERLVAQQQPRVLVHDAKALSEVPALLHERGAHGPALRLVASLEQVASLADTAPHLARRRAEGDQLRRERADLGRREEGSELVLDEPRAVHLSRRRDGLTTLFRDGTIRRGRGALVQLAVPRAALPVHEPWRPRADARQLQVDHTLEACFHVRRRQQRRFGRLEQPQGASARLDGGDAVPLRLASDSVKHARRGLVKHCQRACCL